VLNSVKYDNPNGGVNFDTFRTNPDGTRTINNPDFLVVDGFANNYISRQVRVGLRFSY
jgi:hypothetical protein